MLMVHKKCLPANSIIYVLILIGCVVITGTKAQPVPAQKQPVLKGMARLHMSCGEYQKAEKLINQAMNTSKSTNDSSTFTSCLFDLAYIYQNTDRIEQAEQLCQQGIERQKQEFSPRDYHIAYSLRMLSSIQTDLKKYQSAEQNIIRAITILEENFGPDHNTIASFEIDYADLLLTQNQLQKANQFYEKGFQTIQETYGPQHLYTANVQAKLAQCKFRLNDLTTALTHINQALILQQKMYPHGHYNLIRSLYLKATITQKQGQGKDDLTVAAKACVDLTNRLGPDHSWVKKAQHARSSINLK